MKYRLKTPTIIEAFQFTGDISDLPEDLQDNISPHLYNGMAVIWDIAGSRYCSKGDYIVKSGSRFTIVSQKNFEMNYEIV